MNQSDKAQRFRALHDAPEAFVIANAWDAGSAKLLAKVGFSALATSSGANAGVLGRLDGQVNREEALAHAQAIVEATDLPVSADLEKGFGDAPGDAAETIQRAAAIGLVGASTRTQPETRRVHCMIPRTPPNESRPRSRRRAR